MSDSALFHYPYDQELIDKTYLKGMSAAVNVSYHYNFDAVANLHVVQNYKYEYAAWENKGHDVAPELLPDKKYQTIYCQIPQSKEYSLYLMAQCFDALEEDGLLICMAGNNENGKRLKKWFADFDINAQSESKQKQRIVWGYRKEINQNVVTEYLKKYGIQKVIYNDEDFYSKPGVYGWNKIDNGSKLLCNKLPENIKGYGADYGCGYGFLSKFVLSDSVTSLDCIDADHNALVCAQKNLKDSLSKINFIHMDLNENNTEKKYDWIVMNPPFHQGKKSDSDIGVKFIEQTSKSLKPNGMLYMVSNSFLPYEKILQKTFKNVEKIIEQNGFKILFAQK